VKLIPLVPKENVCPATPASLQGADVDAVFALLELRQSDSAGNLRAQ
jgi:hypothetical protein